MNVRDYGARVTGSVADVEILRAFDDAINARDLDALTALMTDAIASSTAATCSPASSR